MIKKTLLLVSLINFNAYSQTNFEWETAIDNGNTVTESIGGITVTVSGLDDLTVTNCSGCLNSTNNLVVSDATPNATSVTFTFSEPVIVNSILAIDGNPNSEGIFPNTDYTFTPTGGTNSPVTAPLTSGSGNVILNWSNISSFTVSSSGSLFGFDNLSINSPITLSTQQHEKNKAIIFPNPAEKFIDIKNLKKINKVEIYNQTGQLTIRSETTNINISDLSPGIYIVKIYSKHGIETKKFIKK